MPATSELTVQSSAGTYSVRVGAGEFEPLASTVTSAYFLADERFESELATHSERLVLMTANEERKNLSEVERIIGRLRDLGASRDSQLVAVGGGLVQDVATGVAQQFMRGLDWLYVPTTLLAMCDSCVGGKSSLNVGGYKNLAGSYFPPRLIVVDPGFLTTLTPTDRAGGICEAMKIAFCRGPDAFSAYLEHYENYAKDPRLADALVLHALKTKVWFIEVDEFDRSERRQLNLGHTFGHALEAATQFRLQHGIGVGIGVICAERLAVMIYDESYAQPELVNHAAALVRNAADVGEQLAQLDRDRFEKAFLSDKKHNADGLHVILPNPGGGVSEHVLPRDHSTMTAINSALDQAAEALRS